MFALRMLQLIETHASNLSDELMLKLKTSETCRDLVRNVPADELKIRTHEIYRNLSDWLLAKTDSQIEEVYFALGMRRARQGVPFSQFLFAINLTKECLEEYLQREGLLEDPVELLGDMELTHSLGRFFDRALYSAAIGYEKERKEESDHALKGRSSSHANSRNGRVA